MKHCEMCNIRFSEVTEAYRNKTFLGQDTGTYDVLKVSSVYCPKCGDKLKEL